MKKINELCNNISDINSEFKIAMSCTRLGEKVNQNALNTYFNNEEKTAFDILTFLLHSANSINGEENRKINSVNKIKDRKSVARYISRNLKRITQALGKELDLQTIESALNKVLNIIPSVQGKPRDEKQSEIAISEDYIIE